MTAIDALHDVSPRQMAKYKMKVLSFNVQHLLAARGKTQDGLATYLGIKKSGTSLKISRASWKLDEALLVAEYLGVTLDELTNDTVMRMLMGNDAADRLLLESETKRPAAGNSRPRFLVGADPEFSCPGCDSNARHPL